MRFGRALFAFTLTAIIWASFHEEVNNGQIPCAFCILQRGLMILLAILALAPSSLRIYALMLFTSLLGASMALKQLSLHVCPDFEHVGLPVFGLHLYTWSFLIFCCSLFSIGVFLFFYKPQHKTEMNLLEKGVLTFVGLTIAILVYLTYEHCGLGNTCF